MVCIRVAIASPTVIVDMGRETIHIKLPNVTAVRPRRGVPSGVIWNSWVMANSTGTPLKYSGLIMKMERYELVGRAASVATRIRPRYLLNGSFAMKQRTSNTSSKGSF